jgi:ubiquinone biosynthesis protein COQ9
MQKLALATRKLTRLHGKSTLSVVRRAFVSSKVDLPNATPPTPSVILPDDVGTFDPLTTTTTTSSTSSTYISPSSSPPPSPFITESYSSSSPFSSSTSYTSDSFSSSSSTSPSSDMSQVPDELIREALKYVSMHGWTSDAVVAAAADRYPNASIALCGTVQPYQLVQAYMQEGNDQLRQALNQRQMEDWSYSSRSQVDRIVDALQIRLQYNQEFVQNQKWHEGMALGAQPQNVLNTRAQLEELIEIVATSVADPGQPWSVLEKLGLGGVYVAAEMHMLADSSPQFENTWSFLLDRVSSWDQLRSSTSWLNSMIPSNLTGNSSSSMTGNTSSSNSGGLSGFDVGSIVSMVTSSGMGGVVSVVAPRVAQQLASMASSPLSMLPRPSGSNPAEMAWNMMVQLRNSTNNNNNRTMTI